MLSCALSAKSVADPLVALFHYQRVYFLCALSEKSAADYFVTLFHSQRVCYLVVLVQNQLLILLWYCSTLRWYVIWCS
jgi:hypothetical protein